MLSTGCPPCSRTWMGFFRSSGFFVLSPCRSPWRRRPCSRAGGVGARGPAPAEGWRGRSAMRGVGRRPGRPLPAKGASRMRCARSRGASGRVCARRARLRSRCWPRHPTELPFSASVSFRSGWPSSLSCVFLVALPLRKRLCLQPILRPLPLFGRGWGPAVRVGGLRIGLHDPPMLVDIPGFESGDGIVASITMFQFTLSIAAAVVLLGACRIAGCGVRP